MPPVQRESSWDRARQESFSSAHGDPDKREGRAPLQRQRKSHKLRDDASMKGPLGAYSMAAEAGAATAPPPAVDLATDNNRDFDEVVGEEDFQNMLLNNLFDSEEDDDLLDFGGDFGASTALGMSTGLGMLAKT